jgi:osomolarity two-component system phosphorelay intermediate protein YPD1
MTKVKTSCERIQHFGALKAADGVAPIGKEEAQELLKQQVMQVKVEYQEAESYLKKYVYSVSLATNLIARYYGEA